MTRRLVILWGLGVGQAVVGAIAVRVFKSSSNEWLTLAGLAVLFSQAHLAGMWIGAGGRSAHWRLIVASACLTVLTWLPEAHDPLGVCYPGIVASAFIGLVARVFGLGIMKDEVGHGERQSQRLQFSVRSILVWTAVVAVLLSLASMAHPDSLRELQRELLPVVVVHLVLGCVCTAELGVLLAKRPSWIRGMLLYCAFMALAFLITGRGHKGESLWFASSIMAWFAISFVPLRLLGYRFGRCRTTDQRPPLLTSKKDSAVV